MLGESLTLDHHFGQMTADPCCSVLIGVSQLGQPLRYGLLNLNASLQFVVRLALKNRPALADQLADVVAHRQPFKAVLVYDVSRWGPFQDADEACFLRWGFHLRSALSFARQVREVAKHQIDSETRRLKSPLRQLRSK